MKNIVFKKGFTLIEILFVIAIIGVLASVVLGELNSARDKGGDAAIRSDLNGLKAQSAIYYDDHNGSYTNMCIDQKFVNALSGATSTVSGIITLGGPGDGECKDSVGRYTLWVNLKSASTSAWCVDSTGKSGEIPAQDSSAVDLMACP
jgi:prepilin-type N-terminal cleavage/methylation domain-containing protein